MTVLARTVDVWGGLLSTPASGLAINANTISYVGTANLSSRGSLVTDTVLNSLVTAFVTDAGGTAALYTIGSTTIPALGNNVGVTPPPSERLGFINVLAKQAATEFGANVATFVGNFEAYQGWKNSTNRIIISTNEASTFLSGTYSNREDLSTADITNVNLDTANWGRDLQNLGAALDLSSIDTFGLPSNLLLTITTRNLTTSYLRLLLAAKFTETELKNLLDSNYTPSALEQQTLYSIFTQVTGTNLTDILVSLRVRTANLASLADLLNPVKMFPSSYTTLTVPFYTTAGTGTSKVFDFIYTRNSSSLNPRILSSDNTIGNYLTGILPADIAVACAALSLSMQQISGIQSADPERFGTAVRNLLTLSDTPLVGVGAPVSASSVTSTLAAYPGGTGPGNTFVMCDFFGTAAGVQYVPLYSQIQTLIQRLTTNRLTAAYADLAAGVTSGKIAEANAAVAEILATNPGLAAQLNTLWTRVNNLLQGIITARATAAAELTEVEIASKSQLVSFGESIGTTYYLESSLCDTASVLKALADYTVLPGQAIAALLAEAHNRDLLDWSNTPVYSNLNTEAPPPGIPLPAPVLPDQYPGQIVAPAQQPDPNLLTDNIDPNLQSGQFTPDTATQAVIDCNCDCWTN